MQTRTMVLFPYSGYQPSSPREKNFCSIVDACLRIENDKRPVVVLNSDTIRRGTANAFLSEFDGEGTRSGDVEILKVWSVDSCQMWLAGWGHILDSDPDASRIAQVPGDIDLIVRMNAFYNNLDNYLTASNRDIIVGDFSGGEAFSAKNLIDTYGTLPLLANWFPEVSQGITEIPLTKPRSEFLNIERSVLEVLLRHRKFAYEQTLNMLIRSWDFESSTWSYEVRSHHFGEVIDDTEYRKYRDCLDQVERTERMLRLIWREINEPEPLSELEPSANQARYAKFVDEYIVRDRRSTSIRETAIITIRNLIGP